MAQGLMELHQGISSFSNHYCRQ